MLTSSKETLRYRMIAEELQNAIRTGRYPIGSSLPTEYELCEKYGVSRGTAREAVRTLVELGLVERRRGAGTTILATHPKAAYVATVQSMEELFEYTEHSEFELGKMTTVEIGEIDARTLQAIAGSKWVHVTGRRVSLETRSAICATTIYIRGEYSQHLADVDWSAPIYSQLESKSGHRIAEVVQEISVGKLPADLAQAISQRPGVAGLKFVRRYIDVEGATIMAAIGWHPAKDFNYRLRLKRPGR